MLAGRFGDRDGGSKDDVDRERHEEPDRYDEFERRLDAVERALTDGDRSHVDRRRGPPGDTTNTDATDTDDRALADRTDGTSVRVDELTARMDELEARLDELDAATQAVRGYVGGVRAVNRDVERRADLALAKIESLTDEPGTDAELRAVVAAADDETRPAEVGESGPGNLDRSEPTGSGGSREPKESGEPEESEESEESEEFEEYEESEPSLADRFRAVL